MASIAATSLPTIRAARRAPFIAGIAYAGAWVAGLALVQGPALDASDGVVVEHFRSHTAAAIAQSLLVHVLAGLLLAAVAHSAPDRRVRGSGLAAAAISVAQGGVGIVAALAASPTWFEAVNRIDGVKMVVLALFASAAFLSVTSKVARTASAVAVPTLVVAAVGYLALMPAPAAAAAPALLALLVLVPAVGRAAAAR